MLIKSTCFRIRQTCRLPWHHFQKTSDDKLNFHTFRYETLIYGIPSRNRTSIRGLGNPRSIQLNYGDMHEHFKQIKTQNQHFAKKQINVAF